METVIFQIKSLKNCLFGSNSVVKADLFPKGTIVDMSYLLQQYAKLFQNQSNFNNVIQCLISISKIMNV